MHAATEAESNTIIDDWADDLLEGWSGLRHYLRQRRAGNPADPTMDVLLSELLRVNLTAKADLQSVIRHLTGSAAR